MLTGKTYRDTHTSSYYNIYSYTLALNDALTYTYDIHGN